MIAIFLDNVVTSTLVFEDSGKVEHYVGGYSDWVERGKALRDKESPQGHKLSQAKTDVVNKNPDLKTKKLSYKLQRELALLPEKIEQLEMDIKALEAVVASPSFYQKSYEETQPTMIELSDKQLALDKALERWAQLESMS